MRAEQWIPEIFILIRYLIDTRIRCIVCPRDAWIHGYFVDTWQVKYADTYTFKSKYPVDGYCLRIQEHTGGDLIPGCV